MIDGMIYSPLVCCSSYSALRDNRPGLWVSLYCRQIDRASSSVLTFRWSVVLRPAPGSSPFGQLGLCFHHVLENTLYIRKPRFL